MKLLLLILFHPIICISQFNAFQAPISFNLDKYNVKDSILLIEEQDTNTVWRVYKKGDAFLFNVFDDGDELLKVELSFFNRLKKITTSLYTAEYRYGINGKIKSVKFNYEPGGIDALKYEAWYIVKCKYVYKSGILEKINLIGKSFSRKLSVFSYYSVIYK